MFGSQLLQFFRSFLCICANLVIQPVYVILPSAVFVFELLGAVILGRLNQSVASSNTRIMFGLLFSYCLFKAHFLVGQFLRMQPLHLFLLGFHSAHFFSMAIFLTL